MAEAGSEEKKTRKTSRKMKAYIGRLETPKEDGVAAVFTVFCSTGVGDTAIKAATDKLGPGEYDVLTGRLRTARCCETKRNVTKLL